MSGSESLSVGRCSNCGTERRFTSEDEWWSHHDHYVSDDDQPHGARWCGSFALREEPLPAPIAQRLRWLIGKPFLRFGWWIAG